MTGRPVTTDIEALIADVDEYIEQANPPIVAEYAHIHGITRQYLYFLANKKAAEGDERLYDAIKKLSEAKEVKLEKCALIGKYAPNMAIFSLKQLGWSDCGNTFYGAEKQEDDALTASLKELAEEMNAGQ